MDSPWNDDMHRRVRGRQQVRYEGQEFMKVSRPSVHDDHGNSVRVFILNPDEMNFKGILLSRFGVDIGNIGDELRVFV